MLPRQPGTPSANAASDNPVLKMKKLLLALASSLLVGATGLFAQTTDANPPPVGVPPAVRGTPHQLNPNSSAIAQAVQNILQKFDLNRDQLMAERKALLDKLSAATTDAEKRAILSQLKADLAADKAQRAQLGKEIREELKKLREQRRGGG